jgi:hypothetical protein
VGRVAENCGGDAAAARSGEEAGVWPTVEYLDTALDQVVEFDDERDVAGASAFGSLSARPPGDGVVWGLSLFRCKPRGEEALSLR